jgi:hypothetical protein
MEIPVDFAQVNLVFGGLSCPTGAEITLGLEIGDYAGSPTNAAEDVKDAWDVANINTLQVVTCELRETRVKFGPNATGPFGLNTTVIAGTDGSPGVSPNTAFLIHKVTNLGGRAGRGRCYLPGVDETQIDDSGDIDSTLTDAMTAAWAVFKTQLEAGNLNPTLLHAVDSPIDSPTPITEFVCDGIAGSQRRRMRR